MYLLKPTTLKAPSLVVAIAKTFQNLSIPFIFSVPILSIREKDPPGEPNETAHPDVNRPRLHDF
jgi:hypothetical protein